MFRSTSLTIFFIAGIALFFLGVLPLWKESSAVGGIISETELLIAELQNLQQRKDQLVRIYNSVSEENIRKLEAVIPSASGSSDASFLYLFLEGIARENGLRVDSLAVTTDEEKATAAALSRQTGTPAFQLSPSPTTAGSPTARRTGRALQETKVNLVAKGTYESFKSFLDAVESNLRIIDVSNIVVAPDNQQFTFTLVLKTYHQ